MNPKIVLSHVVTAFLLLIGALVLIWRFYPLTQASAGPTSLALKAPPFVSVAKAADAAGANFLEDEAGISAYTNAGQAIDLNLVKTFFRGIERSTADYIIGSVPAPGFVGVADSEEQVDAHVYIHRDGWIVVYYLKDAPVTKMITWPKYDPDKLTRNNLSDIIKQIFASFGITSSAISYYDFRHPDANSLMLITDLETQGSVADTFTFQVPSSVIIFERSWSFAGHAFLADSSCKLNQEVLSTGTPQCLYDCWRARYGFLNTLQVPPDTVHTITTFYHAYGDGGAYCAVGLVYKEAP